MRALTLANLLAWSLQVACVAGVAGALPWIFRLRAPDVRHLYWRLLLALCILLPVVQGRVAVESTLALVAPLPAAGAWTNAVTAAAATVAGTPARQIPLTTAQLIGRDRCGSCFAVCGSPPGSICGGCGTPARRLRRADIAELGGDARHSCRDPDRAGLRQRDLRRLSPSSSCPTR